MEDEAEWADSPEGFLTRLRESLKQKEGVDVGLADILTMHILQAAPAQNAVGQAKDAILKLAGDRAISSNPDAANG